MKMEMQVLHLIEVIIMKLILLVEKEVALKMFP